MDLFSTWGEPELEGLAHLGIYSVAVLDAEDGLGRRPLCDIRTALVERCRSRRTVL